MGYAPWIGRHNDGQRYVEGRNFGGRKWVYSTLQHKWVLSAEYKRKLKPLTPEEEARNARLRADDAREAERQRQYRDRPGVIAGFFRGLNKLMESDK